MSTAATAMMLVTKPDLLELAQLLDGERRWLSMDREHFRILDRKLDEAGVLRDHEIPDDLVTLRSRVRFTDLDTGDQATHFLVMPTQHSAALGTVSVLSPIGAALLGRREGEEIECRVPGGLRRLKIEEVIYQPEAARARREAMTRLA